MIVTFADPMDSPHWCSVSFIRICDRNVLPSFLRILVIWLGIGNVTQKLKGNFMLILGILQSQLIGWTVWGTQLGLARGWHSQSFRGRKLTRFATEIDLETMQHYVLEILLILLLGGGVHNCYHQWHDIICISPSASKVQVLKWIKDSLYFWIPTLLWQP